MADQKRWKDCSLMRCQTWDNGAEMTADSLTEVEVGIAVMIRTFALLERE